MTLNRLLKRRLLGAAALPLVMMVVPSYVQAQVTIDTTDGPPVVTSIAGDGGTPSDVTIVSGGQVQIDGGTAVTIDSDSNVINEGMITSEDDNDVVGVELQGGNTGSFINRGQIILNETFTPEDTDNSGTLDGPFAQGSGRTGILISGASPFVGDVTQETGGSIAIEGNDSFGIRLAGTTTLQGNLSLAGATTLVGTNAVAVGLEGNVIGDVTLSGATNLQGENATAVRVSGDIDGQLTNAGSISNTGYRFQSRPAITARNLLDGEDLLQAGSAIEVSGNVSGGILLQQITDETTGLVTTQSAINQLGQAPAILIDGNGTPVAIGVVAEITDPTAEGFDADLQYAFINQGSLTATGVFNDVNATALEIADATLTNGINNIGGITAATFRSGDNGAADVAGQTGRVRVIVLGDNALVGRINNTGSIVAQVSEASDEIFSDSANVTPARIVDAIAIDIAETANLTSLTNTGTISAALVARNGQAIVLRDASGSLVEINNSGQILALGTSSDAAGNAETNFTLVALDLSANTSGVTVTQTAAVDPDPDDGVTVNSAITGDILLGSGDDTLDIRSGTVTGDLSFGDGADTLLLDNATYSGTLTDSDGLLTLAVRNGGSLTQTAATNIEVTDASFDSTSVFAPTIDGASGAASTLIASGTVTLEEGVSIIPTLSNVVNIENTAFTIIDAGTLNFGGGVTSLDNIDGLFLYDTAFQIDPANPNALQVVLELRPTTELGLDAAQTAVFPSAFEALATNPTLATAVINVADGATFNSAFNQLLPEFAAAGRQFVAANVDGATGAVGSHLDATRRSPDRPGGIWIEEFAYFADRELAGLSEQYRGFGFGFTGGVDTELGPFHAVGLNLGFASTEIEDVLGQDEPLNIVTLQAGAYAGLSLGNLGIEAYAGGGFNDFEASRNINIGSFSGEAEGDWSGFHYNGSLRAGYDLVVSDRFWVRPAVSVDYLSLTENSYEETGDLGVALAIDDRTVDVGSATAMINLGARFQGRRTWFRPALRAGYRTEFINDGVITTGRFVGQTTPFTITGDEFPDSGFLLGLTLAAGSEYSSFGLDLDSEFRDGFIRHTARIVFRLLF